MISDYLSSVARAYESAIHTPKDIAVIECYASLSQALTAQFDLLTAFVSVRFVDVDPYPLSAPMWADIAAGKLDVYTFATLPNNHPMRQTVKTRIGALPLNYVFRAVHDGFAHYPERLHHDGLDREPGYDELRAFRAHARLFAGNTLALRALFTETVAQVATFHYGPTPGEYAEQKAAILPWALTSQALTLEV